MNVQNLNPIKKRGAERIGRLLQNQTTNRDRMYDAQYNVTKGNVDYKPVDITTTSTPKQYSYTEQPQSEGMLSSIGHFVSDLVPDSTKERIKYGSIKDAGRLLLQEFFNFRTQSKQKDILDDNIRLEDVKLQKQYIDQLQKVQYYQKLQDQFPLFTTKIQLDDAVKQLDNIESVIKERWHNSDDIIDNFTNFGAKQDNILNEIRVANLNNINNQSTDYLKYDNKKSEFRNYVEGSVDQLKRAAYNAMSYVPNVISNGIDDILGNNGSIKFGIKNHSANSEYSQLYDKYFKSWRSQSNLNGYVNQLQSKVNAQEQQIHRKLNEDKSTERSYRNTYQNGNWLFDPKKVNPTFRKMVKENNDGLLESMLPSHWIYNVPQMASSFSDIEDFVAQLANQTVGGSISSALSFAIGSGKFKGAEGILKALQTGSKYATAASGLYIANKLRENESGLEVVNAYSSRVLNDAIDSNVDLNKVLTEIDQFAKNHGDDISGLDQLEKIQYGLSMNIKTSDDTFNAIKTNARQGLAKVWNDNQTLSVVDYLQSMAVLGHGGNILKNSILRNRLGKAAEGVSDDVLNATIRNAEEQAQSISDRVIDKIFKSGTDGLVKKVRAKNVTDYIKRKLNTLAKVGVSEGIEEGQQQILQNEYQRGEYDSYKGVQSVFNVPSVFENTKMAAQSVADYLGINFGSPDNGSEDIRKAMNAGAIQGMMLGGIGNVITNLADRDVSEKLGINSDNIRNLVTRLKDDKIIKQIVAENYGKAEDNQHIGIFFDAYSKAGNNARRVTDALNDMKKFKGDLVTNDYIDKDIQLANTTYRLYKDNELTKNLESIGVKRDSEDHKKVIQNGTQFILDYDNVDKLHKDNLKYTESIIDKIKYDILGDESQMSETAKHIYDKIINDFNTYHESAIQSKEQELYDSEEVRQEARKNVFSGGVTFDTAEQGLQAQDAEANRIAKERASNDSSILNKEQYLQSRVDAILTNIKNNAEKQILSTLKKQYALNKILREETGTDIDTQRLGNTIRLVQKTVDETSKQNKKYVENINKEIDKQNQIRSELNKSLPKSERLPMLKHQTMDSIVSSYGEFDGADELSEMFKINAVNNATLKTMEPNVTAYRYGYSDPTLALQYKYGTSWANLSKSQKASYKQDKISREQEAGNDVSQNDEKYFRQEYNKEQRQKANKLSSIKTQYSNTLNRIGQLSQESKPSDAIKLSHELDTLRKRAAVELIKGHLADKNERMKIAHIEFLKEGGLTEDDIDNIGTPNQDDDVVDAIDQMQVENGGVEAQQDTNEQNVIPGQDVQIEENVEQNEEPQPSIQEDEEQQAGDNVIGHEDSNMDDDYEMSDAEKKLSDLLYDKDKPSLTTTDAITINNSDKSLQQKIQDILSQYNTIEDLLNIKNGTCVAKIMYDDKIRYVVLVHQQKNNIHTIQVQLQDFYIGEKSNPTDTHDNIMSINVGFTLPEQFSANDPINNNIVQFVYDGNNTSVLKGIIYADGKLQESTFVRNSTTSAVAPELSDSGDMMQSDSNINTEQDVDDTESNLNIDEIEQTGSPIIDNDNNYNIDTLLDNTDDTVDESSVQTQEDITRQYLNQTFFYKPDSTEPIALSVDGKQLKFKYPVKPNQELAEKLIQPGWFGSVKKFYVVSGSNEKSKGDKDQFTVSLVIYDDKSKSTYITSMMTPSTYKWYDRNNVSHISNGLEKIFGILRMVGVDKEKYAHNSVIARENAYSNIETRPEPQNYNSPEQFDYAMKQWYKRASNWYFTLKSEGKEGQIRRQIEYNARRMSAKQGQSVLTDQQIQKQIDNLKQSRNAIIDAYCIKNDDGTYYIPNELDETVEPENARISNGSINSGNIRHTLVGEENGFGLPEDIEGIDKAIKSKQVLFGVGHGKFGNEPYQITGINGDQFSAYVGTGYSGTIYAMVKSPSGSEQLIPIMLQEERFDTVGGSDKLLNRNEDNLVESFNPETGDVENQAIPSAAEILLYLVCGKLNKRYIPKSDYDTMQAFADLFVNNGEKTTTTTSSSTRALNNNSFLADKQFAIVDNHGIKSLQIVQTDESGNRKINIYTMNDLFANNSTSRQNRRSVIYTIAENMHWNTDVEAMNSVIDTNIIESLKFYFEQNPKATEFSLCGNKQLTFKKQDLFYEKDGVLHSNGVSLLSWMLKNNKLLTTTIPGKLFYAPYVYSTGVKPNENREVKKRIKQGSDTTEKEQKTKTIDVVSTSTQKAAKFEDRFDEGKVSRALSKFGNRQAQIKQSMAKSEQEIIANMSLYDDVYKDKGGMKDWIILDIDKSDIQMRGTDPEEKRQNYVKDYRKLVEQHIQKYLDYINVNRDHKIQLSDININDDDIYDMLNSITKNKVIPEVIIYGNGKGDFNVRSTSSAINTQMRVTGVFQSSKSKGKLDINKSRQWLSDKLGIDRSQVVVLDSVMRSVDGAEVFGVTNVVTDILNQGDTPVFMFSSRAGYGTTYHEAWHYVNLLVHNKQYRQHIYDEYVKAHPKLKDKTYAEIEEILAEEFRKYCETYDSSSFTSRIKQAFDRILKFLGLYKNKYLMYSVYENILSGKYKRVHLDNESLQQFKSKYSSGVTMKNFVVPGISQKNIDKLQYIENYQDFYRCATSLANKMLDDYSLDTIEDIKKAVDNAKFSRFLSKLKRENVSTDPKVITFIQDIENNPDVFAQIVKNQLKQYSISVNDNFFKSDDTNQQHKSNNQEEQDTKGSAENTYDVDPFSVSKKDNVAFRAKLFLGQIKSSHYEIDDFSGEKVVVEDVDSIIGAPIYVPFAESWNQILNNLWDTDSYGKLDKNGEYLPTSIRGQVRRLAKSNKFFYMLDKKLDLINDDIQLQNQIHSTVRSQNAQMMQIGLDSVKKRKSIIDDELESDEESSYNTQRKQLSRDKEWSIMNDNQLRAIKSIPRIWSQQTLQSGMVYNDGQNKVSPDFVKGVTLRYNRVKSYFPKVIKPTDDIQSMYDDAIYAIEQLFNFMSVPVDVATIEQYINNNISIDKINDIQARYKFLSYAFTSSDVGTIGSIVSILIKSNNRINLKSGRITKELDQLFSGYKTTSQIAQLAKAYNDLYPSPQEFSVTAPDGTTRYPIAENNTISDYIRNLNHNTDGVVENMRRSEYSKHSLLLDAAQKIDHSANNRDQQLKLNCFIGLRDNQSRKGNDYAKITPLEDYIAKMYMSFSNMIVLPTMADKKTWYAISGKYLQMPHDLVTYDNFRLSDKTLSILGGYFFDEINSIRQYYSRENISYLVKNPGKLRVNFHGKLKDGRIDFSGAGGKFRYFAGIDGEGQYDLNARLQHAYLMQQRIENDPVKYGGLSQLREFNNQDEELDGFELVRLEVERIIDEFVGGVNQQKLYDSINGFIRQLVDKELYQLSTNDSIKLGEMSESGIFVPTKIPTQLLREYAKLFAKHGVSVGEITPYRNYDSVNLALSAITNNVVSQFISIEEIEKVFTGDPAFYKNYYYDEQKIQFEDDEYKIDFVTDKHSDKIKRLGAILSPGQKLRTDYPDCILKKYPELRSTKYTVLNVVDVKSKSEYLTEIRSIFAKQYLIDYFNDNSNDQFIIDFASDNNYKSVRELLDDLYINNDVYTKLYESVPNDLRQSFAKQAESNTSPYDGITVSDAQVIVRPEMYRKIRIELGQWSFDQGDGEYSDEAAYNIIQNDENWQSDPEKCKFVQKLQLFPLKMSYFQNSSHVQYENKDTRSFFNLPIYNKMAIFPAFKFTFQSDNGKALYDRMNKPGQEIDMIAFESAVKVGANQKMYKPYDGKVDSLDNMNVEDLQKDSDLSIDSTDNILTRDGDTLHLQVQDLNDLRMQLNTEAHEDIERALGTQALKLFMSNLIDNKLYGIGKEGKQTTGKQIRQEIISLINALTDKGIESIENRFAFVNGKPNSISVNSLFKQIVRANGVGANAEEVLQQGGVIEALGSRILFEQGVSKLVNKHVVDVNLNGGSAIQQSVFGFVGFNKEQLAATKSVKQVQTESGMHVLNGGRKLRWNTKENSMEIMLSLNFFRDIIPVEHQTSYSHMRQWLIDHDVIYGNKQDGSLSNPKPIGIGYRIPTQGMSSMFSFIVADVLPSQSGDNIIVPEEFTAQTGSDFDVDKLFIATKSFTNGVEDSMEYDDEVLSDFENNDLQNAHYHISSKFSTKQIRNGLIQKYIDVVSDIRTFTDARGSIDTVTDKIKHELLPNLRGEDERFSGYELLPSFQSKTKQEFMAGKDGIGPYALNVTNLALTQATHITIDYGKDATIFGLSPLDQIKGQDGLYISSWLSAMVNAHVDVAKDPYVFIMGINSATYGISNLLLRSGKGISTFSFLAQPAIKQLSGAIITHNGIYGNDEDSSDSLTKFKRTKHKQLLSEWKSNVASRRESINNDESLTNEEKQYFLELANLLVSSNNTHDFDKYYHLVFNYKFGIDAINKKGSCIEAIMQCLSLMTFDRLSKYADELNDLVRCSQVDTKRFGNNIAAHYNFYNMYDTFKNNEHIRNKSKVNWTIADENIIDEYKKDGVDLTKSVNALKYYFETSWLDQKLISATFYTKKIMQGQSFSATQEYGNLFRSVMYALFGDPFITDGKTDNANYQTPSDPVLVQNIGTAIDSIARNNILLNSKNPIKNSKDLLSGPIDFQMDGDRAAIINKLLDLIYGNSKSEDKYDHTSLFQKYANFIYNLKTGQVDDSLLDLLDEGGNIKNEFLNYLIANLPSDKFPIGRFTTKMLYMNLDPNYKQILESALYQLLTHPNKHVRRLFRDVVFYDYYSSYNNNQMNSIFDVVPVSFKQQYITTISNGIVSGNLESIVSENSNKLDSESYIDQICRNYWYNDQIVPNYQSTSVNNNINRFGEINLSPYFDHGNKVSGIIITTTAGNHPYIKVVKNGTTYLYKKVGGITKIDPSKNKEVTHDVYIIAPKLGIHRGNIHQYEFVSGSNNASIYDDNLLPDVFSEDKLLADIDNYVQNIKLTPKQQKDGIQFKFDLIGHAINGFDSSNYFSLQESNTANWNHTSNSKNDVKFIYSKTPNQYAERICNYTIDINTDTHSKSSTNIAINYGISNDQIKDQINKVLEGIDIDKIHLKLLISGQITGINNTEEEIEQYVYKQVQLYENRLLSDDNNISREQINELTMQFREQLLESADAKVTQIKINDFVNSIVSQILDDNYKIDCIYSLDTNNVGEAAVRSAQLNQDYFDFGQPAYVVLDRNQLKQDNIEYLDSEISKFDSDDTQFSEQENQSSEQIENIVNAGVNQSNTSSEKIDELQSLLSVMEVQDDSMNILGDSSEDITIEESDTDFGNTTQTKEQITENINNKIQIHKGNWSRREVQNNPRILHVFTDNTDRDSGHGIIPDNSWYSKKYGKGHHFPTMTAAVIRGLENARPISTQRWYHKGAKGITGRWTDADINEFKNVIREELQEIVNEFNTGKYDFIKFPSGDGLFNTNISNITKERTPKLYQALGELLHEFGLDSLIPSDIALNTNAEEQQKVDLLFDDSDFSDESMNHCKTD